MLCGRRTPKKKKKEKKKKKKKEKKKEKNSHKIDQKIHFLQISHLSSNRRVRNLTLYFQFTTLARELTHRMKFEYPGRHEFCQKPTIKQHKFQQRHNSSLPRASKTPKNQPKDLNFVPNCTH